MFTEKKAELLRGGEDTEYGEVAFVSDAPGGVDVTFTNGDCIYLRMDDVLKVAESGDTGFFA